jgi:hypothetical protein
VESKRIPNGRKLFLATSLRLYAILCLLYQWTAQFGTRTYPSDSDNDGKADEITVYEDGRLIEQHLDRNFDGKIDVTWNYTNGLPTTSTTERPM